MFRCIALVLLVAAAQAGWIRVQNSVEGNSTSFSVKCALSNTSLNISYDFPAESFPQVSKWMHVLWVNNTGYRCNLLVNSTATGASREVGLGQNDSKTLIVSGTLQAPVLREANCHDCHGSPNKTCGIRFSHESEGAPAISIWVNQTRIVPELHYGQVRPDHHVLIPTGSITFDIAPAQSNKPILNDTLDCQANQLYTITVEGSPTNLTVVNIVDTNPAMPARLQ